MVGRHHQLNGHEFEQIPGVGDGQGNLACCSPWVAKSCTQLRDQSITLPGFVFPKFNLEKHKISNWWNTATIIN